MGTENDLHSDQPGRSFEHRNKEYGAYASGKGYNRQLIKGSVGVCLVAGLCVGGYYWSEPPPEEFGTDAASKTDSVEPDLYFASCDETMPEFPGGREAMLRFIDSALGRPGLIAEMDSTMEEMEKVKVLARFRIETDGRIADIHFPFPAIEPYQSNVRRVLEAMPKWKPGTQNGKPVPMYLGLPVHFLLIEE